MALFKRIRKIKAFDVFLVAGLTALALFMLLPIVFIINHAFKPQNELFLFPPTFFVKHPTLRSFELLFLHAGSDVVPFTRYLFNSVFVAGITLALVILFSAMAAYVLAKKSFPFKSLAMSLIMISLMFAPETVQIPRYLIISGLHANNTYFGHVLPYLASPVAVFLLIGFIAQIPNELIEAIKLDGASEGRIFTRLILPLSAPALATISIFTFQGVWTDVETSSLFMQDETMRTLAFYVNSLVSGLQNSVAGQNMAAAAGLLVFLPNLIMFLLFQRMVMATMVHSGVK
ncbi:carbohydrate ABC transporter permease [Cohnella nanjingensis]|uniref:Carbohydrate ABC transporter permease n=1 Tax=Cohnella nanjingensis TaxID=1387779 RepID=A0A7X0RQY8_9BACL|nr:carbohydrate ABC transporter permease [Cohnella nanjingensis]MBB6670876.1 carbohydrate ABC transporter permease [Cohnella nanjingensis]